MDFQDCRDNAARCIDMAKVTDDQQAKVLRFLADAWITHATELKSNEAFRVAARDASFDQTLGL